MFCQWQKIGRRLKEQRERRGLSHIELSKQIKEKYGVNISRDSLMAYEVSDDCHSKKQKNLGMRIEYIIYLADFYEVSADYLLCLSDTETPNYDIRSVCEYTGLSEDAVKRLHERFEYDEGWVYHTAVNAIIKSNTFFSLADDIISLKKWTSLEMLKALRFSHEPQSKEINECEFIKPTNSLVNKSWSFADQVMALELKAYTLRRDAQRLLDEISNVREFEDTLYEIRDKIIEEEWCSNGQHQKD